MLKRSLTTILALLVCISCLSSVAALSETERPASAEETAAPTLVEENQDPSPTRLELAADYADELHNLGLFQGTDKGYELDHSATRAQAVTLLLRLLGLEPYAKARLTPHPFTDLPLWCQSYVAYAYNSGLANGTSPTTFTPDTPINARSYLTLLLRALGYGEADGLTWSDTYTFASSRGLMEAGEYTDDSEFLRADLVILSHRALELYPKGSQQTLLEQITARPSFPVLANGFCNTGGVSDGRKGSHGTFAGQRADAPAGGPSRPQWDGSESLEALLAELNAFVAPNYGGLTFTPQGIVRSDNARGEILRLVTDSRGRVGAAVFSWRQEECSDPDTNQMVNLALEAFTYLVGDEQAAYALWSWIDASNLQAGGADSSAFGFTDVNTTASGGIIELNGVRIEADHSDPLLPTYWFTPPTK